VPKQSKRAGRLRLLISALVATSVSLVGAVGTAYATTPATGTLEICKLASGPGVTGTFDFRIEGRPGTVEVPVGGCSFPITLPVGQATVTEVTRPGFTVSAIGAVPSDRLLQSNRAAGSARVSIVAGGVSNQTILTFANKAMPKGFLEVCKAKPARDSLKGSFNFTVEQANSPTQTVTVPVGGCSRALQLLAGTATVTEVERTGAKLVNVAVTPRDRLVGAPDLTNRKATVRIVAGGEARQTIVTFINRNDPPPPPTGLVKICKHAGDGVADGTPFTFMLATRGTPSVTVKAGSCSSPQRVPVGDLTVTEKATIGLQVSNISVEPREALVGTPDLTAGTVTVSVAAGSGRVVTEVDFTNRKARPGTLKVCKVAGNGVVNRTPFDFTVGATPVRVRAGSCSLPLTVPAGNVRITEAPTDGMQVTDITVVGAGALVSKDLAARKVTVNVASSLVTEAVFTNARPASPVSGCVWPDRYFKKHPGEISRRVPGGGLTIGGDRLSAEQVRYILKTGRRVNLRLKLQSELAAALLNQLGGASTPTGVQAGVNAGQLLLSQRDGALHKGSVNKIRFNRGSKLTFNGHTYRALQLRDTLRSYNGGKWQGGPRRCGHHNDDNRWNDSYKKKKRFRNWYGPF